MKLTDEQIRIRALELAIGLPNQIYAGMSTLAHGGSVGRGADNIIIDAQKILNFIKPPIITTTTTKRRR